MTARTIYQDILSLYRNLHVDAENYGLDPRSPRVLMRDRAFDAEEILARVPDVFDALEHIREDRITGHEKESVRVCIEAVKRILGGNE